MESLSFPGLGIELMLNRVAFSIGGLNVYWYGIIMATAFVLGTIYVFTHTKQFGLDSDRVIDVVLGGTIGSIIFARLYYVVFSWEQYRENLWDIFAIWKGGIAIYGALIGAFLFGILIARWRKVKVFPMCDVAAGGLILGQAIGRWGNFINIEAFGSNTTMPWGMTGPSIVRYLDNAVANGMTGIDPLVPVHPTFFYESVWCFIGFFLILWYNKRRRFDGEIVLFYTAWYGFGRFFIEGLRTDSLMLGNIRISQALALVLFIAATAIIVTVRMKIKKADDPEYLMLYVNTEEGKMVASGEFYKRREVDGLVEGEASAEHESEKPAGSALSEDTLNEETEQTENTEENENGKDN